MTFGEVAIARRFFLRAYGPHLEAQPLRDVDHFAEDVAVGDGDVARTLKLSFDRCTQE